MNFIAPLAREKMKHEGRVAFFFEYNDKVVEHTVEIAYKELTANGERGQNDPSTPAITVAESM